MLFCKVIHKGCQEPNGHARILIWLMHFSFILGPQSKPGIQLMDALLNYPCFTFQNEKHLRCPSISHVGEQPERMERATHGRNMRGKAVQWVQKVSLANHTLECNSYNSDLSAFRSMNQDQLENRLHCPHGRDICSRYASNPLPNLAKSGKRQSEVSIYDS